MPTIKQRKLAKAIVENLESSEPLNKKELLVSVGYDQTTAEAMPGRTIEQKGVQEELEKLGFSEDNAKRVVAEIMNNPDVEPNARLKATDQTFKIHGSYAPERHQNVNVNVNVEAREKSKEAISQFLSDKMKGE